jgi:hypothetical protein
MTMPWWLWILIALLVLAVAAVVVALIVGKRARQRTVRLRERFGPEYDRAVETAGGRRAGEAELEERLSRRQGLQLRPAGKVEQDRYDQEWAEIEAQFDDAELPALARADALVTTLLAECGYPMESFDQRAADLKGDYPEAVGHYRRAHGVYRRADEGEGTHEDFYEALQHYQAFLDALLAPDSSSDGSVTGGSPATAVETTQARRPRADRNAGQGVEP